MKLVKLVLLFICVTGVFLGIIHRFIYAFTSPKVDAVIWILVGVSVLFLWLLGRYGKDG
jgi:hypothetical protein